MNGIFEALAEDSSLLLPLILGPAGMVTSIVVIWLLCRSTVAANREREQTRRELAAYVAEGSITAEDAERMLTPKPWWASMSCWGGSSGEKAEA